MNKLIIIGLLSIIGCKGKAEIAGGYKWKYKI